MQPPLSNLQKLQQAKYDAEKWSRVAASPDLSPEAGQVARNLARSAAAEAKLRQRVEDAKLQQQRRPSGKFLMTPEQHRRQAKLFMQSSDPEIRALAYHRESLAKLIEARQSEEQDFALWLIEQRQKASSCITTAAAREQDLAIQLQQPSAALPSPPARGLSGEATHSRVTHILRIEGQSPPSTLRKIIIAWKQIKPWALPALFLGWFMWIFAPFVAMGVALTLFGAAVDKLIEYWRMLGQDERYR